MLKAKWDKMKAHEKAAYLTENGLKIDEKLDVDTGEIVYVGYCDGVYLGVGNTRDIIVRAYSTLVYQYSS